MIKSLIRQVLRRMPDKWQFAFDVAVIVLQETRANWTMPVYRVRGPLAGEDIEGTLVYLGDQPQYKSWVSNIFSEPSKPERVGTVSFPSAVQRRGDSLAADIILCPTNPAASKFLRRAGWRIVPKFVDSVIDLRRPVKDLIRSKGAKDDVRVVRKLQYEPRILTGEEHLREYYEDMLLPMVETRHKDNAHISQWDEVRSIFADGHLLGVYRDGAWVAAILIGNAGDKGVRIASVGWRAGDAQLLKDRVAAALFYHAILWAQEQGFETMNLGGSLPFVSDGPLNFKLKWGADLRAPELAREGDGVDGVRSYLAVATNTATAAGRAMLKHNPLLEKHDDAIRAIAWQSDVPRLFKHQVDRGFPWIDLSDHGHEGETRGETG